MTLFFGLEMLKLADAVLSYDILWSEKTQYSAFYKSFVVVDKGTDDPKSGQAQGTCSEIGYMEKNQQFIGLSLGWLQDGSVYN